MRIQSQQNFWAGVMFVILGLFFATFAVEYQMGTAAKMGPGYFPFWLGVILAVLGAVVAIAGLSPKAERTEVAKFNYKTLGVIIGNVVLFGILLRYLGLYVSAFLLVVLSSMASHEFKWKVAILNGICLVVAIHFIFIVGLGLIFPLWPSFLGMN
ncbi:Tripartite tricarboxylate transporter TctB family protein [Pigmentiphaga humi]|uniref:Tripartite tricarboxylate transporter TctB family protein n=1 Tax=Pigmentiphaga humi TaxID=2478468 RepID=A0A3P4B3F3_9BURK|nr:tripartite tricarboxylate transporter TctB family protein [Pigmentiphaga humi]VCU70158.1 Tripartite tricarboxylate transporter TctB family protein [Pigmentiphaga humi]